MKQAMFTVTRLFRRQISIFPIISIFEALEICPSANTNPMTAFWYSIESSAQCASNELNFIALGRFVQVLQTNETGHVSLRVEFNSNSSFFYFTTVVADVSMFNYWYQMIGYYWFTEMNNKTLYGRFW